MNTIYFFASFGDMNKLPGGGGQTAARRLLDMLRKLGYHVITYNRHRYYFENRIIDRISTLLFAAIDPVLYCLFLLFRHRRCAATLYMGYTGSILWFDYMIAKVSKMLGFKSIMYLAGGKAKWSFEEGSKSYRKLFKKTMMMYDEVMTEGEINIGLVKSVSSKTKTFSLPNFTENGFAPSELPKKSVDKINICYFGRIDAQKNVLLSIEVFNSLSKKYDNIYLTLVGNGHSDYEEKVDKAINVSPYKNRIIRENRVNHTRLAEILKEQHFYIFPSSNPCEGHSNALNEAMSWGLIPVVSNFNFLPSIVGDEILVANDFTVEAYYKIFEYVIDNNLIDRISEEMFLRVKNNFVQPVVEKKLKVELDSFFK